MNRGSRKNLKVEVNNQQILSIALPITLAILVPQINLLTNAVFLGQLSEEALGNAGITGVFYLIFAVAGNGFNNAMQTVFSLNAGLGSTFLFKNVFSQGIRICLFFSLFAILFTWSLAPLILKSFADPAAYPAEIEFLYIRILGLPFLYLFQTGNAFLVASLNSKYLMVGFLFEAVVNVLLDYILIFGNFGFPAMGFNGAAVASVIAEFTGMIIVFSVIKRIGLNRRYNLPGSFKYEKKISNDILRVSVPLVFQYLISVTTWLIFFIMIESRGTMAKAISNTMRNVFGMAGIFIWSFASTTNTMISNIIGQKKEDLVMRAVSMIMIWSLGFTLLICFYINLFPVSFFKMFGQDESFINEGIPVIRIVSLGLIFMSVANIWLNAVTGTGNTKVNLVIEVVAIILYLVYTYYVMKINYISLAIAWSNEFIYWFSIFLMSYMYMKSGKWKKKIYHS